MKEKLALYGFNNLTKTLSFNIYDICYAETKKDKEDYIAYIDEQYNSERLTAIIVHITEMIGAHILNISRQDYEPQGASVNILIAEQPVEEDIVDISCNMGQLEEIKKISKDNTLLPETLHAHLDKSHVTVHTFPESHPEKAISTFRVDIDVATCGTVSPLNILDYLIASFDSDIISIDYRVRGFTRDTAGQKHFLDHPINSIQNYISDETLQRYEAMDINIYQANIFHSRMMIKEIELQNYLFNEDENELSPERKQEIYKALKKEMIEIFSGMNIYD